MKGVEEINEIIKKLPSLAKGSLATGRSEQREHRPVRASVGLDAAQERICSIPLADDFLFFADWIKKGIIIIYEDSNQSHWQDGGAR